MNIVIFGIIGGLVAGFAMAPLLMLTGILAGMSEKAIPFTLGLAFGMDQDYAFLARLIMYFIISILIGIIFLIITYKIKRFRIISFKKGIGEGVIVGIIIFVIIFLPISIFVIPAVLIDTILEINLGITSQQTMVTIQQAMPMIIGGGILGNLVFGAVLGATQQEIVGQKVIVLDPINGNYSNFISLKNPDPNFRPIGIEFDERDNGALYITSIGKIETRNELPNGTPLPLPLPWAYPYTGVVWKVTIK